MIRKAIKVVLILGAVMLGTCAVVAVMLTDKLEETAAENETQAAERLDLHKVAVGKLDRAALDMALQAIATAVEAHDFERIAEANSILRVLYDDAFIAEQLPTDVRATTARYDALLKQHSSWSQIVYNDYHPDRSERGQRKVMRKHSITRDQLESVTYLAEQIGLPAALDAAAAKQEAQRNRVIYYAYHGDRSKRGARKVMREYGITRAQLQRIETWAKAEGIPAAIHAAAAEQEQARFEQKCGKPPIYGTGTVMGARHAIKQGLHDPDSLTDLKCSQPHKTGGACWRSGCTYRASNARGAMVRGQAAVHFKNGNVTHVE